MSLPIFCAYDRLTPINSLIPHPKNPNVHPEEQLLLLSKILRHQGWRSPIVVSNRSHYIVAGHGRLQAALLLNQDYAPVNFQDFSSEGDELAHLLADNKIQEKSFLDLSLVQDIIQDLDSYKFPDLTLTGFDASELGNLDKLVEEQRDQLIPSIEQEQAHNDDSIFMMKGNQVIFPSSNLYGIPDLLTERNLFLACPPNLSTWTGPDSIELTAVNAPRVPTPFDASSSPIGAPGKSHGVSNHSIASEHLDNVKHTKTWLYNWGTDSRRGLDMSQVIISFYTDDLRFECFWNRPFDYVARLWNNRVLGAITPNFSLWDNNPLALNIFNVYRSRWVGRYMQEAGVPIIPDIAGLTSPSNLEFCTEGIPVNLPCISVQIQTSDKDIQEIINRRRGLLQVIDRLKPHQLLLYVGDSWERIIPPDLLPKELDLHVIPNRVQIRRKIMNQSRNQPKSFKHYG